MTYTTHADLGGQPGFGPVTPEPEGELFHGAWEPRALALTLAMGCLLYTSPSPRDGLLSRMPSSA